jgi:hypothetical protein
MNLLTNATTVLYWFFTQLCENKYAGVADPVTGEMLTESNKKFEVEKVLRLP